jgi:hypothetical protein
MFLHLMFPKKILVALLLLCIHSSGVLTSGDFLSNNLQYITNKDVIFRICDFNFATRSSHRPLECQNSTIPVNSVICVRGDKKILESFFKSKCLTGPYTLVTLESDESVPQDKRWIHSPNLKKWYAWNAIENSGVISLPIGLNHDSMLNAIRDSKIIPWTEKKNKILLAFKPHRPERQNLLDRARNWDFADSLQYKKTYHNGSSQIELYENIASYRYGFMLFLLNFHVCVSRANSLTVFSLSSFLLTPLPGSSHVLEVLERIHIAFGRLFI